MTPEQAEEIYYAEYRKSGIAQHACNNPVSQKEIRRAAWQAVIDAIYKEVDTDWAKRILALNEFNERR